MNWSNVKLIVLREVRDQLRDRRTLFTIAVLPLLLYPLLGMAFLQVAQFMHAQPVKVWIVGTANLPAEPALMVDGQFDLEYCPPHEAKLLQLKVDPEFPKDTDPDQFAKMAADTIQSGEYAAVVFFPPGFANSLAAGIADQQAEAGSSQKVDSAVASAAKALEPRIIVDVSLDRSRIAYDRLQGVLGNWRRAIIREFLVRHNLSPGIVNPFEMHEVDISEELGRRAAIWSKILPFIVLIWALTGAFYPAIDLCAGEKERGTLETLLSSPAERSEIVWGKLITIMMFSMATAVLNLMSMGVTGAAIIYLQPNQIPIGPPPVMSIGWLLLVLVPVCGLFSALALAIAAFARSTKEGQYYLMPLLLISLPLMILPMLPSAELNLGTSLIPITGVMLLLRALIEGQYTQAAIFAPPVMLVTLGGCLLAVRWAIDQFNNESVLFRESEQWSIGLWIKQVIRERGQTPTLAQGITCGVVLLLIRFFASVAAKQPASWNQFVILQSLTLVGLVALPAVLMAFMFTRDPRRTLLLKIPPPMAVAGAVLLALSIHPLAMWLADAIQRLYPIQDEVHKQLAAIQAIIAQAPSIWHILALMALLPAICEELAFRGFILSGLRHMGRKWSAIVLSSVFFGLTHGILQQSISATLIGMVVGLLAVQTGSLLPGIAFHLVYNSLSLLVGLRVVTMYADTPWLHQLFVMNGDHINYQLPWLIVGTSIAFCIFWWFQRLGYAQSAEEELCDALQSQTAHPMAAGRLKL